MNPLRAALTFPARRPIVTLAVAGVLTVCALLGVSRLRLDTSIESMFARNDPAADAMVRVLNGFGAVEELLVLVEATEPEPEQLLAFARRLEDALTTSPDAAALIQGVYYRADEDTLRFVERVIAPAGIFYLDDAAFAQARERLTPEGMRAQLRRNEALLSQPGPAAAAAAKALLADPLRLHEFLKPRFAAAGGPFATANEGALLSPDKEALLIRVIGRKPPSDLDFCRELVGVVRGAAKSANSDALSVSLGGAYAIATTSERAIRADSIASVTGAFICLTALFAIVYRRPVRLLALAVGPLVLGSILGFAAYAIFEQSMTVLSAAVGAMMVGMGIDYSVHYLTHYERRRTAGHDPITAASETSTGLFAAVFAAWITSVMGFAVVGFSDIPALGTFALLGSLGLAGVFIASLTVIPALLVITDRTAIQQDRARLRFTVDPLLDWIARHAKPCIAFSLIVFVVSLGISFFLPGPILALEPDLTVMHPRPNPALDTQAKIASRFGSVPGSMLVHLRADSPGQLVALSHEVDRRLHSGHLREAGIAGTLGLATLLPDPSEVSDRMDEFGPADAERIVNDFRAALADSVFDAARYEQYIGFLSGLLSRRTAPTLADLMPYKRLARSFLPSEAMQVAAPLPAEAITVVSLSGSLDERSRRAAAVNAARGALADLPGATLAGMSVLGHDAEHRVEHAIPRLFGVSLALVLVYVLFHFRSFGDAMLSLTTAVFGLIVLLAVMRLAGIRLNLINLIGLPLLIGMTVDYGIFLVSLARLGPEHGDLRENVASSAQAVLVCAGTTLLGFGSLAITSVPAVRSLGFVVVVGMAAALAAALFLLTPLLIRKQKGQAIHSPVPSLTKSQQ